MSTKPIGSALTKMISGHAGKPQAGRSWLFAKRGLLRVYDDRLTLGSLTIPCNDIERAKIWQFGFWTGSGSRVLEVETAENSYQFSLNGWAKVVDALPFDYTVEKIVIPYAWLYAVIRTTAVIFAIWLIIR